jgi:SSS family solute:Na+ symporter
MHFIDLALFVVYIVGLLGFGYYFFRHNKGGEDYYVGGRNMSSYHIGLSVVATDVGGGFSIGLGGLGFTMGIAGSWMLFTGLVGAWLAAVFLIPKIKQNTFFDKAYTFPQLFEHYYSPNVALVAAIISAIGYAGFTSSQMLAGAKLASGTFEGLGLDMALYIMGAVAVIYTVMGGLKAVIYTDTIQWTILMIGLVFIGVPFAYMEIGGMEGIRNTVSPEMLSLFNLSWQDFIYWGVTIIPIWFVGMTLYQRIYACKDEKTAKKAWYLAGLFEWPVMAFLGVLLGLFARVAADQGMFDYLGAQNIAETDPETGLPMLLRTVLPVGFLGAMMAAYFSAILSTADSCLMASSGNVVTDIIGRFKKFNPDDGNFLKLSQFVTLVIGSLALLLAVAMENVLTLMLDSYSFMVSGLFVPVIGALFWQKSTPAGAMSAMIVGGTTTLILRYLEIGLPFNLDPNVFGITASAVVFVVVSLYTTKNLNKA